MLILSFSVKYYLQFTKNLYEIVFLNNNVGLILTNPHYNTTQTVISKLIM
jgi:hypothetical protein